MASLTVEEARTRAGLITVQQYDVRLDLDCGPDTFESRTTIRFEANSDADTFVELAAARAHKLVLDGVALDPDSCSDGRLPLTLTAGPHELVAEASMAYSHDGEGMHRATDPIDDEAYCYAMSFLDAAPRIFCCFDQPDLKAPYMFSVRAPADWIVLGNATSGQDADGSWRIGPTKPLSTYFVTLVAGPYYALTRGHDGITMGLVTRKSLGSLLDKDADELFGITARCFDAYHELFGIRYPFGDYYQCFVPEFNAGAMENPGCVTFRDSMIFRSRVTGAERGSRARVIAHEMAHQWFGDLVTMRWWDDLWLNESFAEYMAYRISDQVSSFDSSWVDFSGLRKPWGLRADQRPSTHPVAGNGAPDGASALTDFDGISYAKGASVLKQLAAHLGDAVFLDGVRMHLRDHAYANATLDDLFSAWRSCGAHRLDEWAQNWLRTSGTDTIGTDRSTITVAPSGPASRPHTFSVAVVGPDAAAEQRVTIPGDGSALATSDDDLVLLDTHDDTWARFRLDPTTLSLLPSRWQSVPDPVSRGALWLGIRDAVEHADLAADYAVDCLAGAVPYETQDVTLIALASWADSVLLQSYLADGSGRRRIADAYAERLATSPAGSELQLAAARGLVTLTQDAELLAAWLAGRTPDGVTLDDELRWQVVTRLARYGALSGREIHTELERDPSSAGRIHATRALAALPDTAAKEHAWQTVTADLDASNYEVYAAAEGFWWPEQAALHAPYVERYFHDLPATQGFRTGWVVGRAATLAFPDCAVSPATLAQARTTLRRDDLLPGVRRGIADCASDLESALASREASAR